MVETFRIYKGDSIVKEGPSPLTITGEEANKNVVAGEYKATRVVGDSESSKVDIPSFKTLPIPVSSVSLDKSTADVAVGGSVKLTPTVLPENTSDKSGSWSSSDTAVATVSGGTVTVKADATVGATTDVTFTTKDGAKTATCTITVIEG